MTIGGKAAAAAASAPRGFGFGISSDPSLHDDVVESETDDYITSVRLSEFDDTLDDAEEEETLSRLANVNDVIDFMTEEDITDDYDELEEGLENQGPLAAESRYAQLNTLQPTEDENVDSAEYEGNDAADDDDGLDGELDVEELIAQANDDAFFAKLAGEGDSDDEDPGEQSMRMLCRYDHGSSVMFTECQYRCSLEATAAQVCLSV